MSRGRGGPLPPNPPRTGSAETRRSQSDQAKQAVLDRYKQMTEARAQKASEDAARRASRPQRSAERFSDALAKVPFYVIGTGTRLTATSLYKKLGEHAVDVLNNEDSKVLLCWPHSDPSPAAVASMIALSACGATDEIQVGEHPALSAPMGLRALIYPYARTAHRPLRHIYVDKDYLADLHIKHQLRRGPDTDAAFADYHKTVARSRSLKGVGTDGQTYLELRHPCLDELMPSGPCHGSDGRSELLWRVGGKTDLGRGQRAISRTRQADDPAQASFYLFGLRERDGLRKLGDIKGGLDLVFLDLDRTGRGRLGQDWENRVSEFVEALRERFGAVPILAMTDDPWTYNTLRFGPFGQKEGKRGRRAPGRSSVLFAPNPDIVASSEYVPTSYSGVESIDILGYAGETAALLGDLRGARRKAFDQLDRSCATLLGDLCQIIRRCAALPGSVAQLNEYVTNEAEGALAAADLLAAYRIGPILKELRADLGAYAQLHRGDLNDLCARAERLAGNVAQFTPMAPLFRQVIEGFTAKSSRTVVVFPKDMVAEFAAHIVLSDPQIGTAIRGRMDKGMVIFTDRDGLKDLTRLPPRERNHIKTLIVVAPSRSSLISLMTDEWLPDRLIVLSDSDTLSAVVRDAEQLGDLPELAMLADRMKVLANKARPVVDRLTGTQVILEMEAIDDLDFPVSGVVNLAGRVRSDQPVLRFEMDGGQIVLARPGTKLVVQDRSRAVPTFSEDEARAVEEGDRVCVIGDAFLAMARPILNITVHAAEEIKYYHKLVLERFAQLEGVTRPERLRTLVARMGRQDVTQERALYWVDLEDQLDIATADVVPHAPQDWETFLAFMRALQVADSLAQQFWTWAVIAQRRSRLRAAFTFHDAYRGILIDSYSAQSDNPERAHEIRRLRAGAENFVSRVRRKIEQRGDDART